MQALEEMTVHCPYCGEPITVLVDSSVSSQQYIEDCQVCCRPIEFDVTVGMDGEVSLHVAHEDD